MASLDTDGYPLVEKNGVAKMAGEGIDFIGDGFVEVNLEKLRVYGGTVQPGGENGTRRGIVQKES